MQVTRVTASIDFPLPLRIDLGESEQITEFPQLREPIDKESSQEKGPAESWEYIFHFFTAPSPYPFSALVQPSIYVLYRHRGNMIAMSKTRKRIGGEWGGDIIDETRDRWIASWIIPFLSRSLDFFFPLSSFFQWYFITFPMIVLEQLSRNWRSSVIERLLKKKKKTGIYLSNENWDIIRYQRMSSIIPPPYLSCSSSNVSDCSSKRERKLEKEKRVHNSTGRKHYRNVTDNRIFLRGRRISRKISGLIKSHDEPSRVTRRVVRGERASFRL